jgi:uncharacterized protein involved in exopolysaccharide biosynthesis
MGIVLLSYRRIVVRCTLLAAAIGLAIGLLTRHTYQSSATFIPQGSDPSTSGLALAASELGVHLPVGGDASWDPPIYVELLGSRGLLDPIARDTFAVAEMGGRRVALMDLLEVDAPTPEQRVYRTVEAIRRISHASEDKKLGAVGLTVTTRWASVSLALAKRLVTEVNEFNVSTRRTQATAEREFAERQASEAERSLREAEDSLQVFLQRNRTVTGSPELQFRFDRMQREVSLRQGVYTTLVQNREEARVREVRDTPVITMIEEPSLAAIPEPRRSVLKSLLGAVLGFLFGAFIAFSRDGTSGEGGAQGGDAQEFASLLRQSAPAFLRRRMGWT